MKISLKDIKAQYSRTKKRGWMPMFEEIAVKHGTTTAHFLAIASRETNIENIKGDFRNGRYNGFGVMQVDIGTDPEFTRRWSEDNPEPGIQRGGGIYQEKVNQIKSGQGRSLQVRGKRFQGKSAQPDDIRRLATAAYNSGLWSYYYWSNNRNMDSGTTGKDYSRDVYDRAIEFAKLREADGEVGALNREIELQGKYSSASKVKSVTTNPELGPSVPQPVTDANSLPTSPTVEPKKSPTSEVKLEQLEKQGASITTKVAAAAAPVGAVVTALGLKIGSVELSQMTILAICGVLAVALVIGAWIYNEGQKRGHNRQNLLIEKAASQTENTVRII